MVKKYSGASGRLARMAILSHLPATVKALTIETGFKTGLVNYHIVSLEAAGLVKRTLPEVPRGRPVYVFERV